MTLIVEEEKIQMTELKNKIEESAKGLDLFKEEEEFSKQNDLLKKEIEKAQQNFKATKQSKYKRDTQDFERDQAFDLTIRRRRSGSIRRGSRSQSRNRRDGSPSTIEENGNNKTVTFLEEEGVGEKVINTPSMNNSSQKKQNESKKQRENNTKQQRGGSRTRSQNR